MPGLKSCRPRVSCRRAGPQAPTGSARLRCRTGCTASAANSANCGEDKYTITLIKTREVYDVAYSSLFGHHRVQQLERCLARSPRWYPARGPAERLRAPAADGLARSVGGAGQRHGLPVVCAEASGLLVAGWPYRPFTFRSQEEVVAHVDTGGAANATETLIVSYSTGVDP